MKVNSGGLVAVALLSTSWGQQPAAPRPPTPKWTAADLAAIPVVPPRSGKTLIKRIFDGKTLTGWTGNAEWWSVEDSAIVAKSDSKVPTSFLFTTDSYSDFRLTLVSKVVESENHAGVSFWGDIVERPDNKWYTRGPLVVFPNPSMWDYTDAKGLSVYKPTEEKVTSQHDWVKVEILAQGNQVRAAFNGVEVLRWREANESRVKPGPIGVQLHAWNGPQKVLYRDILIETFPKDNRLLTVRR